MSPFKNNSLAVALFGAVVLSLVATQGCSSDEQSKPAGSGGSSQGGSGGKSSSAGSAGKPISEGGAAGQDEQPSGDAGMGGEMSMGGEGGAGPECDLSFNNGTLEVFTDNGGKLPPLP
jgi:hypothetical protein